MTKEGVVNHEFISNRDFTHSDLYYDFVRNYTSSNYPYKVRPFTIFDQLPESVETKESCEVIKPKTLNLVELFQSVAKSKDQGHLVPLFEELYNNTKSLSLTKTPSGAKILNVKAFNFLSIKQLDLDFDDWKELIISGGNGQGKSSCLEILFFTLTGKNTKKLALDDLKRYGEDNFGTSVTLKLQDNIIEIQRSRKGSESILNLVVNGTKYRSDSVSNTQKYIYELLGVSEKELLLFSYFSTFGYESFTDMSAKPQYEIIAKLAQTEQLDALRDASISKTKEVTKERDSLKFYHDRLVNDLNSKTTLLESLEALSVEPIDVSLLQKEIDDASVKLYGLNNLKTKMDSVVSEHSSTDKVKHLLQKEIDSYKKEVEELASKRKLLLSGKCYTCGQDYSSQNNIDKINLRLKELSITVPPKMKELGELSQKVIELKEKVNTLADKKIQVSTEISKCKDIMQKANQRIGQSTKIAMELGKLDQTKSSITEIEESIENTIAKLSECESILAHCKALDSLLARSGGLVTYLFNNTLELVNARLKALTFDLGFRVKLVFNGELEIKVSGFSAKDTSFNNLSGGERKLVEISLIGAFINTYNTIYNLESGLLGYVFLDETVSYVDSRNIDKVKTILNRINSNIVLITHEINLKNEFDHCILVSKTDEDGSIYQLIS